MTTESIEAKYEMHGRVRLDAADRGAVPSIVDLARARELPAYVHLTQSRH